jgi:predicted ATP-binding protein involved in virulence
MNNQLRIDSLNVRNYRCFKSLETPIQFHPNLTVFVARNGEGKTAFLDAIRIAFGTFTSSFPISTYAHFQPSDVHIATLRQNPSLGAIYPVSLEAVGTIEGTQMSWSRALQKVKGRTTQAVALSQYGEFLRKKIEADESNISLPLIVFYGTGRLWSEHRNMNDTLISPLAESRFAGYDNALSARSTYKQVKNWLLEAIQMEDSKESSNTQTGQFVAAQLNAIKKALYNVLGEEGVDSMHYNRFYKDDITVICKNGDVNNDIATALPVSWLSDGLRAVFSMVADIAYRCVKLNPHLGENACVETHGIVLIDEVDIFLHPSWQQRIIGDLQRTFPNIQFIVTTHSPQVISSVSSECIRVVADGKVLNASIKTDGARAEQILGDIFGVEARCANSEVAKNLAEYQLLINQDQWDSSRGKELWAKLQEALSTDPVLAKLAMRVHLKEYQRIQNEKN